METRTNILLRAGLTMNEFNEKNYIIVRGFLDAEAVQTVSRYMEYSLKSDGFKKGESSENPNHEVSTYYRYADPLTETILYNSLEEIEQVVGKKLFPTYSYSRVYVKGDELKAHTDRESCEFSVSVNVATKGEHWPLYMQSAGKPPTSFILEPGDAVIYKGCEVLHWREKAINTEVNVQFMLHYVDQSGSYSEYKFDGRESLGSKFKQVRST